jgi:hypothetical protein
MVADKLSIQVISNHMNRSTSDESPVRFGSAFIIELRQKYNTVQNIGRLNVFTGTFG